MNETTDQKEVPAEVTLAQETLNSLLAAIATGSSPLVTRITQLAQEVANSGEGTSAARREELWGKESSSVTKILALANALRADAESPELGTLTAVLENLGSDRLRNLSIALLLMEAAEKAGHGSEKKQAAAHALSSGVLSQVVLEYRGGANPEDAFLSGVFRGYGQLILVHFRIEAFKRARRLVPSLGWDQACREVFGLSSLDVGFEVLSRSQMPKSLLDTLHPVHPDLLKTRAHPPLDLLAMVSEFSAAFCDSTVSVGGHELELAAHAQRFARRYGKGVLLGESAFAEILDRVRKRLSLMSRVQGLRAFSNSLLVRLMAKEDPALPERSDESRHRNLAGSAVSGSSIRGTFGHHDTHFEPCKNVAVSGSASNSSAGGRQALLHYLAQLDGPSFGGRPPTLREALGSLIQLLHHELRLCDSVVFLRDEILSMWTARVGYGELFHSICDQPLLSLEHRDVFTLPLSRGEDAFIPSADAAPIQKHLPEWLLPHVVGRSLVLLPLKDGAGVYGVICAIGEGSHSATLTSQLVQPLRDVRAKLARLSREEMSP